MNHTTNCADVDKAMKQLPAASAEAANPSGCGGERERNEQDESGETYRDEGALGDVFPHGRQIEGLVWAEVGEEVEAGVEEGEEAEHAAEADEIWELKELAQRSDAKSDDEEAQGPVAGGVLKSLDLIWTEVSCERAPDEDAKGCEAKQKNGELRPFVR